MHYPLHFAELISRWAFNEEDVTRVWIFGSYSRGEATSNSDLDVAVAISRAAARPWGMFTYWMQNGDRLQDGLRNAFLQTNPSLVVNLDLYHYALAKIPYSAISHSGLEPVYKRPRSARRPCISQATHLP